MSDRSRASTRALVERDWSPGVTRPGLAREKRLARGKPLVVAAPLIQPKLTVNPPNDRYEQEADRVAEQVMRMPAPAIQRAPT